MELPDLSVQICSTERWRRQWSEKFIVSWTKVFTVKISYFLAEFPNETAIHFPC